MRSCGCLLLLTGTLFLAGCGGPSMGSVHGRVTCNGKAVADAAIIFSPVPRSESDREAGKAASGSTDADGRYSLSTFSRGDGALVGKHRVAITLDEPNHTACKSKVVTREVQAGSNEFNIELTEP